MSEQSELEDRISYVHRLALIIALAPIALMILFAYGLAWLVTPECDCDD
jgi:hypothetical protein